MAYYVIGRRRGSRTPSRCLKQAAPRAVIAGLEEIPMAKAKVAKKKVKPIPDGYQSVTPYLSIRGAAKAIDYYKKAFGAKEAMRMPGPHGKLGHAEIVIGGHKIMLSDEYE